MFTAGISTYQDECPTITLQAAYQLDLHKESSVNLGIRPDDSACPQLSPDDTRICSEGHMMSDAHKNGDCKPDTLLFLLSLIHNHTLNTSVPGSPKAKPLRAYEMGRPRKGDPGCYEHTRNWTLLSNKF